MKDEKDEICPIQKLSEESQKLMQYLHCKINSFF